MAEDQERGERLRALKDAHPSVRWGQLADAVGVRERSVLNWAAGKGIEYENAVKAAVFFRELGEDIDDDYIWRGARTDTPSPFAQTDALLDRIAAVEDLVKQLLHERESLKTEIAEQNGLLAQQSALLEEIRGLVAVLKGVKRAEVSEPAEAAGTRPAQRPLPEPPGLPPSLERAAQERQPSETSTGRPGTPARGPRKRAS